MKVFKIFVMRRIVALLSLLAVLAGFTACNGSLKGDQEVAELKSMLLDANGNILFDATSVSGLYELGVESKDDATALVGLYAGSGFTGDNYTRTIAGNKGTVKVTKGSGGVFYSVRFGVEGIPAFTLDIVDYNGENEPKKSEGDSGTWHTCNKCHKSWRGHSNVCPWTSKHKN